MSKYLEILAKNINWYLDKNHKKPSWLATESGVKPPNLSKILARNGNPTLETIEALSHAMEMTPADLIRPYETEKHFEAVWLYRKSETLSSEITALKKKYEHATGDRPRTTVHPQTIMNEINRSTERLLLLRERLEKIRESIRPAQESKQIETPPSDQNIEKSKESLIIGITTRLGSLPSFNNQQLGAILGMIDNCISLNKISNKTDAI